MKKFILPAILVIFSFLSFNSCILVWDDSYHTPSSSSREPAIEFLKQQGYPGSFSSCKKIDLADRYKDSWYENYEYRSVYSYDLRKNVIVRCKNGNYNSTSFSTFESNYLYLKYQNELQDCIKSSVSYYFDRYKILIDADWLFTDMYQKSSNLTNLKSEMTSTPYFILIKLTDEEANKIKNSGTDFLEGEIYKTSARLYDNGYKGYKKFFVMKNLNPASLDDIKSLDDLYEGYSRHSFDVEYEVSENQKTVKQTR